MREIRLTMGQVAFVDDEDYESVALHKWCAQKTDRGYYARRNGEHAKHIYLHRVIMNAPLKTRIDHRDNNGLNCQKGNLRFCTQSGNSANSRKKERGVRSKYKGVTYCDYCHMNQWRARIKVNGKPIHLGYYNSEKRAAVQYDAAALRYFGEFALTNFENACNK